MSNFNESDDDEIPMLIEDPDESSRSIPVSILTGFLGSGNLENCLRAIYNYNIETATRTGNPNAFSYFTQICFYAFIRRITKEKKQQDIKFKFIEKMGIEDFVQMGMDDEGAEATMNYVDTLRQRISTVRKKDEAVKQFAKDSFLIKSLCSSYNKEK